MNAGHAIAGLLLLANLALLGLVGFQSQAGEISAYTPAPLTTLKAQINQERRRVSLGTQSSPSPPSPPSQAPATAQRRTPRQPQATQHLLAGIEGFDGAPCHALAEFLDLMAAGIIEAGGVLPEIERASLLAETSCSIDDPEVNRALRKYRGAWIDAGMAPLSPFRHLGKKK